MEYNQLLNIDPWSLIAWNKLLKEAQGRRIDAARDLYESVVKQFPSCSHFWRLYIAHELRTRNLERVERLFQRCLLRILQVDLWRDYLRYIRETKASLPGFREKMAQAYDLALEKIGVDSQALPVWLEYIEFLQSQKSDAVGSFAENQRIVAVRRAYHLGLVTPLVGLEQLWKDYAAFETGVNPALAKKMLEEHSREYMNARRVVRELESVSRGLIRAAPALPPRALSVDQNTQVALWRRVLEWEKGNPLHTDDVMTVVKRVMYAFEQALQSLEQHAEFWLDAALYLERYAHTLMSNGEPVAAQLLAELPLFLERAISGPMRSNALVGLAFCEIEESRGNFDKVKEQFDRMRSNTEMSQSHSLIFVHYLRFLRRTEGLVAMRRAFRAAREEHLSYHVFLAAAELEMLCAREEGTAQRIVELALRRFPNEGALAVAAIDLIERLNDESNTRAFFERLLSNPALTLLLDAVRTIWDRFLAFEARVGDQSSILQLEQRRLTFLRTFSSTEGQEASGMKPTLRSSLKERLSLSKACAGSSSQSRASEEVLSRVERYRFFDLLPVSEDELSIMLSSESASSAAATSVATVAPCVRPRVAHWEPFKPLRPLEDFGIRYPVAGGDFAPPPTVERLLRRLPPPHCFAGPFVIVDGLLSHLGNIILPDKFVPEPADASAAAQFDRRPAAKAESLQEVKREPEAEMADVSHAAGETAASANDAPFVALFKSRMAGHL